jgi:7-cyano-7-deazaguanine reductase
MTLPRTMPNERPGVRATVTHRIPLPRCCPVSGNPQPGSELVIRYRPGTNVLELYALDRYVRSFVGGRGEVRSMETMIQQIAQDCAGVLGVRVRVRAVLVLQPSSMTLSARAEP